MSLDLALVSKLRWGLAWLLAGRLGEDGSVQGLIKISVKPLTYTGSHLLSHAYITSCLANQTKPDKPCYTTPPIGPISIRPQLWGGYIVPANATP